MTPMDFKYDPESPLLDALPAYEPDRHRTERIRKLCHAELLSRRKRPAAEPEWSRTRFWSHAFGSALVAALCAVYLAEVARRAMTLYGF